jgi:hypothetical protein
VKGKVLQTDLPSVLGDIRAVIQHNDAFIAAG